MTRSKREALAPAKASDSETNGAAMPSAADLAKVGLDPLALAAGLTVQFTKGSWGDLPLGETYGAMLDSAAASGKGDHADQRAMLIGQSHALNAIFVEMARRAAANMGHSLEGMERYMRLALKAQAQSRATIEALDRLANGREQTVRHVHVDNRGGQAVIAETVTTGDVKLENPTNNPMHSRAAPLLAAKRCGAKTRKGCPCRSPTMANGRCRMHGGKSPGAPLGNRNAWRHGARSAAICTLALFLRQSPPDGDRTGAGD